jgi:hypothetical protein
MLENEKSGHGYGAFSWRIGMLRPISGPSAVGRDDQAQ